MKNLINISLKLSLLIFLSLFLIGCSQTVSNPKSKNKKNKTNHCLKRCQSNFKICALHAPNLQASNACDVVVEHCNHNCNNRFKKIQPALY